MKRISLPTAALIGALAAGCAARGPAAPSVAVLEVKGAPDGKWQEEVAELAAGRRLEVIPAESYWTMATRLRATRLNSRDVARVAAALRASAVVHGRVSGGSKARSRRQVVTIYVRDGESGRVVETHRIRLRRGVPVGRTHAAFEKRLLARYTPPEPVAPEPAAAVQPPLAAKRQPPPARKPAPAREAAPRARASEPSENAPPVVYDRTGQAIDEEKPPVAR